MSMHQATQRDEVILDLDLEYSGDLVVMLEATLLNDNLPPVKGHFFSDDSGLTNRPDTKTKLSLIFLKICAFKGQKSSILTLLSNFQAKNPKKQEEILKKISES